MSKFDAVAFIRSMSDEEVRFMNCLFNDQGYVLNPDPRSPDYNIIYHFAFHVAADYGIKNFQAILSKWHKAGIYQYHNSINTGWFTTNALAIIRR